MLTRVDRQILGSKVGRRFVGLKDSPRFLGDHKKGGKGSLMVTYEISRF